MERKSSKEYSVVFLVEGEKVQVTKFAFDFIFVTVFSCELGRHIAWVQQHLATVPTSNIAELVPSGFFCPQPCFLQWENLSQEKHPRVYLDRGAINKSSYKY